MNQDAKYTEYGDNIDAPPPKNVALTIKGILDSQNITTNGIPKEILRSACLSCVYEHEYKDMAPMPDGTVFKEIIKTKWELKTEKHRLVFETDNVPQRRGTKKNLIIDSLP